MYKHLSCHTANIINNLTHSYLELTKTFQRYCFDHQCFRGCLQESRLDFLSLYSKHVKKRLYIATYAEEVHDAGIVLYCHVLLFLVIGKYICTL